MNDEDSYLLMSGNEAIARGALEAGVGFCASYPGTPSTEIATELQKVAEEYGIYVEWSVNEKVALEAAAGASWAGIPALCPMKSLGLNVASDFLLNLNLSGSGPGGLVIVVCDDPRGHSSSNEQDSRFYAKASYLPLLEPSSSQEAKDLIGVAFDISQKQQIPVFVRSTTRLSHSSSIVEVSPIDRKPTTARQEIPDGLYNVPNPHLRHKELNETKSKVHSDFEDLSFNSLESTKASFLILASGVAFRYAKEAAQAIDSPHIDVAKLTSTHPIPQKTILKWLQGRKRVLFIEEVDPFIEEQVLSLYAELEVYETELGRIEFYGKQNGFVPAYGELNTDIVLGALAKILRIDRDKLKVAEEKGINLARELLIPRPLTFCAGCTHRNIYWAIRKIRKRLKEGLVVAGDIGCYSLGVFYDGSMNTMQAMGSGIGTATGLGQLHRFGFEKKVIAVAGDSTFFHACIPALINARHKNANITFLILDNATTAMTGFQLHPGTDPGEKDLTQVSIERIVNAIGPDLFEAVDATDIDATTDTLHRIVQMKGLKVLLCKSICRLEEKKDRAKEPRVFIASEACHGEKCRICVSEFACPALEWDQSKGVARIIKHACIRCGTCIAVCPHAAIQKEGLD